MDTTQNESGGMHAALPCSISPSSRGGSKQRCKVRTVLDVSVDIHTLRPSGTSRAFTPSLGM